jgi:hypothetical protein
MLTTKNLATALLGSLALAGCAITPITASDPGLVAPSLSQSATATAPSTYAWQSACDLLVGVDGSTLIDEPLGDPYVSKPGRCQMKGSTAHSTAALELYIVSPGGKGDFDYQKTLQGVDNEIAGLGDAAFQSGDYLHVLRGDNEFTLVAIRTLINHPALPLDDRVAAARKVLAHTGW